uniref:Transmembrane protein 8B-like n=1 Tax=Gouania willdenowi TaxID=441366 RepID=A0A8C5H6G6_GOUWI
MDGVFLRVLFVVVLTAWASGDDGEVTFVSELSSKPAQKLSKYSWYGNVRLQRFYIPEETAIARWLFSVTKSQNFYCGQHNVTIHIRWGSPPVVNPIGAVFPNATLWSPSLLLTLPVTTQSSSFNLSNPAPGYWFVAAHLPEDDGRIQQKGFPSCSYLFQPQLSIRREVDTPVLQQNTYLTQTAAPNRPARLKLYVPQFASSLSVTVAECLSAETTESGKCLLVLKLGSASLQQEPVTVNCTGTSCSAALSNPPWDTWVRVLVESDQVNRTVTFSIISNYTGELKFKNLIEKQNVLIIHSLPTTGFPTALFEGYSVAVNTSVPKDVLRLPFPTSATWYLTMQLICNSSDCGNTSLVSVVPEVSVSGCVEDCGTYGECRLLRSYTYLYSACVCKAGWNGWGCTDGSTAQSYGRQLTATLLLTLSNLFFLPAIAVAIKCWYITEASVYIFTMFFSTFYHACDQPGVAVMCIMDYDALQYCDFLGSTCSIWVTILCMARIKDIFKYTLFMLGALLIAMSMQLDRKGLWNLLGPVLCALMFMIIAWTYRGVRRRHCYPPSWRRWAFHLIPGILCALIGVCLYIFAETEDNYYYTHSLWHILVATCVVFLLPPMEKEREACGWSRGWNLSWTWKWRPRVCGYTLCESSSKDELYTVT